MSAVGFAEVAVEAARRAVREFGLPDQDLALIRVGDRAVLSADGGRVILRVARGAGEWEEARREVQAARWLLSAGLAVTEPLQGEQPVMVDGTPVSAWRAVQGEWTVPAELGVLLRGLHALTPPPELRLPEVDWLTGTRQRIDSAPALSDGERRTLRAMLHGLREELAGVEWTLPRVVLHGDANIGNVLKGADGRVVLFDLGGMCWGNAEWDLVITAVYRELGWHSDAEYAEFCDAYGVDVTALPGYRVLRVVQELRMTCWLAQKAGNEEKVVEEVHRRVDDLMDPERPRHWHPY